MRVAEVLQETSIPEYSRGLLSTESRKTCTNLANSTGSSHDSLYRNFDNPVKKANEVKGDLIGVAKKAFEGKSIYLLLDDSQISKPYAKDIAGLDFCFDGSTGKISLGLQIITVLLTDGDLKIPVDVAPYISKQLLGDLFKTKSQLAIKMVPQLTMYFDISIVLADAHYATQTVLSSLSEQNINCLMKFPRNRIVTIGNQKGQLQDLLKLRRNQRIKSAYGSFGDIPCYFYVVKLENGTQVYFVSLCQLELNEIVALYKIRWKIEIYHRTAKQSLGWKDCQMKALGKQVLHTFYVMHAYAIAELVRVNMKFSTTEDAIRYFPAVKTIPPKNVKSLADQNSHTTA